MTESIFFILMVLVAVFILFKSPLFEVRQISVEGTSIPSEKIINVSGISSGQNIFKLDLKSAQNKIQLLPLVKNVNIARQLPATVNIKVEERKAVGVLQIKDGFAEVDDEGVFLRTANVANTKLPVLTGASINFPGIGKKIESEKLSTLINVVCELPQEILPKLSEIHIDEEGSIQLYMLEGIQCRLGLPEKIKEKSQMLLNVLQELQPQGKKIEYIELTYYGKPVVKYSDR
jgi:cell division protein FtsQ